MSGTCTATERADVVAALSAKHRGADNGIGARELAGQVGMHERQLRVVISALREEGTAICGTPSTGYYIAETASELQACCAFLRQRAMHSLRLESRLRNIPLPELLGQLHLPT